MKLIHCFFGFLFLGTICNAQDAVVDFKHLKAEVAIDPAKKAVSGKLVFSLEILKETDSIFIDARNMEFSEVLFNGNPVAHGTDGKRLWVQGDFQPSEEQELKFHYSAAPKQALYFIDLEEGKKNGIQVWTQGQGKYTSHWLPSFDDTNEKLEFDLEILYPVGKTVIANGKLLNAFKVNDSLNLWQFDMKQPMSSYLVAVAAGDYESRVETSTSGLTLEQYYPSGEADRVEPTYRHSKFLMDFMEREIGVPYPWQNYKQVPVRDFLYAGMENTGTTIFSDMFLVDSIGYNDRNYTNVDAHELAHQWFGNMVTAASGEHHWLQEGFSTYYALLAEKEIYGEDYFYYRMFESAEELKMMSDSGKGEALLSTGSTSLTYYQKGAWALHILKEKVGETAFEQGVRNYLEEHAFGNVTTNDFIAEMEQVSGQDLSVFVKDWLEQSAFQGTAALNSLRKSEFIQRYLQLAALKPLPISEKRELLATALDFPVNDYIGQEVVHQLALEAPGEVIDLYKKAFESNNLYTRQAIAVSLQEIPKELKKAYEGLLDDESYVTREAALYNLWRNFPKDRVKYLEKTRATEGFLDKNIRTLWLALNLATPEVAKADKKEFFKELSAYTAPHNRFQVRQQAYNYLYQLNAFNSQSIYHLMDAARHPNYRFREFAKGLLNRLKEEGQLDAEEQQVLQQKTKRKP